MTGRRASSIVVAICAIVASACAPLPAENTPRAIDHAKVPELFPDSSTTVPTVGVPGKVCFVPQAGGPEIDELECRTVPLERLSPRTLVDALAAGPDEAQRDEGLATLVPQNTRLLGAVFDPDVTGVMIIDLSNAINQLSSPNNTLAYRQIIETLTDPKNQTGAKAIRVKIDGKFTKIPTDDGPMSQATPENFHSAGTDHGSQAD